MLLVPGLGFPNFYNPFYFIFYNGNMCNLRFLKKYFLCLFIILFYLKYRGDIVSE